MVPICFLALHCSGDRYATREEVQAVRDSQAGTDKEVERYIAIVSFFQSNLDRLTQENVELRMQVKSLEEEVSGRDVKDKAAVESVKKTRVAWNKRNARIEELAQEEGKISSQIRGLRDLPPEDVRTARENEIAQLEKSLARVQGGLAELRRDHAELNENLNDLEKLSGVEYKE